MKTLLTIPTFLFAVLTGFISYRLFRYAHYDVSEILTVTSFLSLVSFVALLSSAVNNIFNDNKKIMTSGL